MPTTKHQSTCSCQQFYKKATATAHHYGFEELSVLLNSLESDLKASQKAPRLKQSERKIDRLRGELVAPIEEFIQKRRAIEEPMLFYSSNAKKMHQSTNEKQLTFGLHVLGAKESIAEALLLRAALSIIEDLGLGEHYIEINSIGDRDSSAKFVREATNYLKNNIHSLSPHLQQLLKEDVFSAAEQILRKEHPLSASMPRPIEFLSTANRRHFHELLEFLDTANLPYEMNDSLLGHRDCYSHSLYTLKPVNEERGSIPIRIQGGRYDEYGKRYLKTQIPSAGLVFSIPREKMSDLPTEQRRRKKPEAFFIHIGNEAKLRSIDVVEQLRRAHIAFNYSLGSGGFSTQLSRAEESKIPYAIIMGQREALSDAVIVRDMDTRIQETVPVSSIGSYFRERRKKKA